MNHKNARQNQKQADPDTCDAKDRELDDWLKSAIDQHEHRLVRYAQQFVVDLDRARDVVQDTYMKLCRYESSSKVGTQQRLSGSHLTKWLYKVCRNRAIDVARKENRMKSAPPNQFDERLDAQASTPDAAMLEQERQETLLAQIANLSANQQEVLRLKFHGGLTYQEIAEITGLTRTNVGFLLHSAITKLRQRVAAE